MERKAHGLGAKAVGRGAAAAPLAVVLLAAAAALPVRGAQAEWNGVERVVAIGDVHGDYEHFVEMLRSAGLVDAGNNWAGGKAHLVQLGDLLDRGPDSRRLMDLLMELENQAEKAGGRVHALIGNHEAMNLLGDLRYVAPGDYEAFRGSGSERLRELAYTEHIRQVNADPPPSGRPVFDATYRAAWDAAHPLGFFERSRDFGPQGRFGAWIRRHNAVIKIDDTLYLHGGIAPRYAGASLREINEAIRRELRAERITRDALSVDPEGPLWYRGLAQASESSLSRHVTRVLEKHGISRIVIGHTVSPAGIATRFDGRVVLADVGLSQAFGRGFGYVVVENGAMYALQRDRRSPLAAAPARMMTSQVR